MRRALVALALLWGFTTLSARPANPLSVGADLMLSIYQKLISPLQGGHICNFSPSCSAFSRQSYRLYGPLWGTLMTFDRLERCNPGAWKHLETYYSHIANERLYDPPCNHNLPARLKEQKAKSKDTPSEVKEEELD
ncbi:MAG: membrane protein insertion efficiency factor YidD [candidate division WOR-3 bacterium]|nr:membrane protein insertion efficiency factor YidD [candidate division WOR-3 bacterium]